MNLDGHRARKLKLANLSQLKLVIIKLFTEKCYRGNKNQSIKLIPKGGKKVGKIEMQPKIIVQLCSVQLLIHV